MSPTKPNPFATALKTNAENAHQKHEPDPAAVASFIAGAETHSPTAPAVAAARMAAEVGKIELDGGGSFFIGTPKLKVNPYDARHFRSKASLDELRADMAANGQNHAIQITREDKDGFHIVIDGRRRWLSTEANGKNIIEAKINHEVDPDDPVALYWHSYVANNTNEKHRDYDDGMSWGIMIDEGKLTLEEISSKTGKSKSTISQMTSYRKLTPEMLAIIEEDPDKFPYTIAYQLHRLVSKDKKDEALKLTAAYAQSQTGLRDIQTKVDAILEGKTVQRTRKTRVIANPLTFKGPGTGEIVAYDDGTLELSLTAIPHERRDEITKRIQEMVESIDL